MYVDSNIFFKYFVSFEVIFWVKKLQNLTSNEVETIYSASVPGVAEGGYCCFLEQGLTFVFKSNYLFISVFPPPPWNTAAGEWITNQTINKK